MAFKYPVGHILSPGGYIAPEDRGMVSTPSFGAGAEPPDTGFLAQFRQQPPAVMPELTLGGANPLLMLPAVIGGGALATTLPAIPAALPAALPMLTGAVAIGAAGVGLAQALGFGEGGGLFGLNILGGDEPTIGGLEFGGPGLAEPKQPYTEWRAGNKQFYHVPQYSPSTGKYSGAKIAMYNRDTKKWKVWRLPKPYLAIIGKNMPRHQMIVRLRKNLRRHTADAKTILQVSSPAYYAKMTGYHKHRR